MSNLGTWQADGLPGAARYRHYSIFIALTTILATVGVVVGLPSQVAQAETCPNRAAPSSALAYVALGDSYSAGEGLGCYERGTDRDTTDTTRDMCHRSDYAYSQVLFPQNVYSFRACSSATSEEILSGKFGEPSQLSGQWANTRWVSVTAGGNDIGFGDLGKSCISAIERQRGSSSPDVIVPHFLVQPLGLKSCDEAKQYAEGKLGPTGAEGLLRAQLASLYEAILMKKSDVQLVVGTYPKVFPASFSGKDYADGRRLCVVANANLGLFRGWFGFSEVDAQSLQGIVDRLNWSISLAVQDANQKFPGRIRLADMANAFPNNTVDCGDGGKSEPYVNGALISPATLAALLRETADCRRRQAGGRACGSRVRWERAVSTATFHPTRSGQAAYAKVFKASFDELAGGGGPSPRPSDFSLPLNPVAQTFGPWPSPSGDVWFGEITGSYTTTLKRLSPTGTVLSTTQLPTQAVDITFDATGNALVLSIGADQTSGTLQRVTPAGATTTLKTWTGVLPAELELASNGRAYVAVRSGSCFSILGLDSTSGAEAQPASAPFGCSSGGVHLTVRSARLSAVVNGAVVYFPLTDLTSSTPISLSLPPGMGVHEISAGPDDSLFFLTRPDTNIPACPVTSIVKVQPSGIAWSTLLATAAALSPDSSCGAADIQATANGGAAVVLTSRVLPGASSTQVLALNSSGGPMFSAPLDQSFAGGTDPTISSASLAVDSSGQFFAAYTVEAGCELVPSTTGRCAIVRLAGFTTLGANFFARDFTGTFGTPINDDFRNLRTTVNTIVGSGQVVFGIDKVGYTCGSNCSPFEFAGSELQAVAISGVTRAGWNSWPLS